MLVVDRPGQDEGDSGEEAGSGWEDGCVAVKGGGAEVACQRDEEVTSPGEEGMETYVGAAGEGTVGKVGG